MILNYITSLTSITLWELLFLSIITYNFIKILSTNSTIFILGYFFFFLLFNGLYFIFLECDLPIIILWIIYFGVLIIFIVFFFTFNENNKPKYTSPWLFYILIISCLLVYLLFSSNLSTNNFNTYINFYNLLNNDNLEELELLGFSFIVFSYPLLLIVTYILLLNCLIVVSLFILIKFTQFSKNTSVLNHLKGKHLFSWIVYKNQTLHLQDEENTFQNYSFLKNYKVTSKLHRVKTWKRRI